MDYEKPIESTKVIPGYKIEHYSDDEFVYDEFQSLETKPDTIIDRLERMFLTSLFLITVTGIVFIIHCL